MPHLSPTSLTHSPPQAPLPDRAMFSPMILSDRLITLAQDADRAGFAITAEHLVHLAHTVFEEPPRLT